MALKGGSRFPVAMVEVFPHGCHLVPDSISEAIDYDEETKRRSPAHDKLTGKPVFQVRVIDLDPELSGRSREVVVKVVADRMPVPPTRQPFEPVEFENLTVTPYVIDRTKRMGYATLVADIREPLVRRWRKGRLDAGVSAVTVAKAYRLLKAIMNTAADDGLIRRNPCRIKGASAERSPERPVLTVEQVFALAEAIDPRYKALVLLAVFGSMRWGELAALRRCDVDLDAGTIRVVRQLTELSGGRFAPGPPKSDAGKRVIILPAAIMPVIRQHMSWLVKPDDEALVFTSPAGSPLRRNFRQRVWLPALRAAELPVIHFHDLRHTGNTLAASAGAGLRELMDRMGHSTARAAMIYRDRRAPAGHRRCPKQAHRREPGPVKVEPIGHTAGTEAAERLVKIGNRMLIAVLTCAFG
jgi:integrase